MNRREFISGAGATLLAAPSFASALHGAPSSRTSPFTIRWRRHRRSRLFDLVTVNGRPLLPSGSPIGLLDGCIRCVEQGELGAELILNPAKPSGAAGPIRASLTHRLLAAVRRGHEDLLEATLTLQNRSSQPSVVQASFLTAVNPDPDQSHLEVDVPLSASGLRDPDDDPRKRLKECRQPLGAEGFLAHYLEPQACDPRHTTTRAPLLAPVIDLLARNAHCRVALFGVSDQPASFEAHQGPANNAWRMGRRLQLAPGESRSIRAYLLIHSGEAPEAWAAFRRFGHHEDYPPIRWARDVRVHYYDFLSAAEAGGPRGDGYDVDSRHFREFHVGLATQHGYYLSYGDFVHPDRKEWLAMPTDEKGPVRMSLAKIKERVDATRRAGVRPAIYLHYSILDEGSPLFEGMRDSILVDANGQPTKFGWEGPDVIKTTWRMSHAAAQWRDHLVQQARWVMELFNPDAIVLDETFTACGWDHHKAHGGPLSPGGIDLMRRLRATVRSFGPDKALFASDCSMGNLCLWGDGEAGDHCYDRLLGHELYRKPPIRYLAALGDKPWLPCAWLYKSLWPAQVDLARKVRAAVSVTNGWGDGFGLTRLPQDAREQMLRDIASLVTGG